VRLATFVALAHQPGLLQDANVLRDGRLRDASPCRQGSDGLFSFTAQSFENRPTRRVGERSEQDIVSVCHRTIHNPLVIDKYITRELWVCQTGTDKEACINALRDKELEPARLVRRHDPQAHELVAR